MAFFFSSFSFLSVGGKHTNPHFKIVLSLLQGCDTTVQSRWSGPHVFNVKSGGIDQRKGKVDVGIPPERDILGSHPPARSCEVPALVVANEALVSTMSTGTLGLGNSFTLTKILGSSTETKGGAAHVEGTDRLLRPFGAPAGITFGFGVAGAGAVSDTAKGGPMPQTPVLVIGSLQIKLLGLVLFR